MILLGLILVALGTGGLFVVLAVWLIARWRYHRRIRRRLEL